MKITRTIIIIVALLMLSVAQSQNVQHNAKVMGVISIGQKDVAIINDLITGEVFKTTAYNQGLLVSDEDIQLNFSNPNDENKAKIVKQNLSKNIFCFKENQSNACEDLCTRYYGSKMVVIRYTEGNIRIVYRARTNGSKTNSNVRVFKKNPNGIQKIVSTSFLVDTNITSYKLLLHKDVIAKANHLKNTLTEVKCNKIITVYENFLLKLRDIDIETFKSEKGQSTYFHFAIYNTIRRSIINSTDCNCLPLPYYLAGRSPFMCQKDFVFDVARILQTLDENKDEIKTQYNDSTILTLTNYFKIQTTPEITFNEMYFSLYTTPIQFEDDIIQCFGGSGSDLGCCGNYSGCCWYSSLFCLAHDAACGLSGCEPALVCLWDCN